MNQDASRIASGSALELTRRDFFRTASLLGSAGLLALDSAAEAEPRADAGMAGTSASGAASGPPPLDFAPGQWLWYPGDRVLPNTFVLFRRVVRLSAKPRKATGWIMGESRYLLEVNGRRVQWGPAPNDPRWPEVDPVDLTERLGAGENVIGATVLYFGHGDSTWPIGRAGFIFRLELELADGSRQTIGSDGEWRCHLSSAWQPGHHRRWFLGALQEEFDARRHPHGWSEAGFAEDADWLPPAVLPCPSHLPILCHADTDVMTGIQVPPPGGLYGAMARSKMEMRPRSIPLMRETWIGAGPVAEHYLVHWIRPIAEYFAVRPKNAFSAEPVPLPVLAGEGAWKVELDPERGTALTFALPEEMVGWPGFTIEAPAGTTCELMTQEGHALGKAPLLNTTYHKWARFTCRAGVNHFQWFDYDCLRWIQIHLHPGQGTVVISRVGVLRRSYPWPHEPAVRTSEAALQKLFSAATNTLRNSAVETFVDGNGRERSQYSSDCAYQQHAADLLGGDPRQVARFLRSYSQGITPEGYFLDCWPSVDRLDRWGQRQVEATHCGAILDAGVQFSFDCWQHYGYAGNLESLREAYPRLLRFARYLREKRGRDGLLPVEQEDYGFPIVYLDFKQCFPRQRNRQCPFNLKVAAMYSQALAPMARAFGDEAVAADFDRLGGAVLAATTARFWSAERGAFVDNLPWAGEDGGPHYSDLSLAMSVMFDQCPGNRIAPSVELLATRPKNLGLGYPTNACWRFWALGKGGRPDSILLEFRQVWAKLISVRENNTIEEFFGARPDGFNQWSHAACVPIYVAAMSLAGIRPLAPGFSRYEIRPQLGDLPDLELEVQTPRGPIGFAATGALGRRTLRLRLPAGAEGELAVAGGERPPLEQIAPGRFRLPAGQAVTLELSST